METVISPTIAVGFHAGNILSYLSQNYGDGFLVVRELVQNSLDKRATHIYVRIDCVRRLIYVYDDGAGASLAEISKKFQNIGLSLKLDDPDATGEKGIGNLAGLAIADEWQLLTRSGVQEQFHLYSFERKEFGKKDGICVSHEVTQYKKITEAPVGTNTMLRLLNVDELSLKQLKDSDVISRTLTEAFRSQLRNRKIELRVSYKDFSGQVRDFMVKAPEFRGRAMEPEKYETPLGYVEFAFYHSPRPVPNPSVLVQHKGVCGIPLHNFFAFKILGHEVEELFRRGYFEGEIKLGFCTLAPSRATFVQDGELREFVKAVNTFVAEILKPLIDQLDQEGRDEKHRRIAEGILKRLHGYFKKHPSQLPAMLRTFILQKSHKGETTTETKGSKKILSTGVIKPPKLKKKTLSPDAFKKQRVKSKSGEKSERPKSLVLKLDDGIGIKMTYPEAEESFAWHSRATGGIIEVNVAHADFLDAERRGLTKLSDYLFLLMLKELTVASLNPSDGKIFSNAFEGEFVTFWRCSLD